MDEHFFGTELKRETYILQVSGKKIVLLIGSILILSGGGEF